MLDFIGDFIAGIIELLLVKLTGKGAGSFSRK